MLAFFFNFEPTLNRLFNNFINLTCIDIRLLDYFFLKHEVVGEDQIDPLPEKAALRKPSLIWVNNFSCK